MARAIQMVLVTSTACHLCEHAKDILARLTHEYPMQCREVDITSDEGRKIVRHHRAPFPPILLIDGRFHCHGRVSEKKLRNVLDHAM